MLDVRHSREAYDCDGYVVIKEAATPETTSALLGIITDGLSKPEAAARFLSKPTINAKPTFEFPSRVFPPLSGVHWGLTSLMRLVTGRRLAPSYGYFRAYQKGDVCTVHTDRQACEHSMSLALGYADDIVWEFECGRAHYDYETACKLRCSDDFGEEAYSGVRLEPGDAIVYKGVNRRHGRITPNPNRWSAHVFLHWVDLDGPFSDWAFDKTPPIKPRDLPFDEVAP